MQSLQYISTYTYAPHIRYVTCFVLLDDILGVFTSLSLSTGADILVNDG